MRRDDSVYLRHILDAIGKIEAYPEDRPIPSGLLLGFTESGRPIHAVAAVDEDDRMLWLVAVYEPTLASWLEGYQKRMAEHEVPPV